MFKKVLTLVVATLALGLAACNNGGSGDDDDMFSQNSDSFEVAPLTVSIVGSKWASWDPAASAADESCVFTRVDSSLYRIEDVEVATGDEFKVIQGGSWAEQYGFEDINWDDSQINGMIEGELGDHTEGTSNRTNFKIVADGTVTIEFRPYNFEVPLEGCSAKLTVLFTPAA